MVEMNNMRSSVTDIVNRNVLNRPDPIINRIKSRYVVDTGEHWIVKHAHNNDIVFYLHTSERAYHSKRKVSLRRLIYLLLVKGNIPAGRILTNNCGVFNCVRPEHLRIKKSGVV